MLSHSQVEFFRAEGYLVPDEPVLTEEQVEELKTRLDSVIEGRTDNAPERVVNLAVGDLNTDRVVVQVVNIWEADPLFHSVIYNRKIVEEVAQLVGDNTVRLWHDQIQYKPPVIGGTTDWHQDHPYWPIIEPADLVSCWIAIDHATPENGCMNVVPQSHKWGAVPGLLQTDEEFKPVYPDGFLPSEADVKIVPCEVKPGHCMYHHCLTWHASYLNKSQRHRRAFAIHYMPGYTKYVPQAGHVVEHRVEVGPGEVLKGKFFPTVLEEGVLVDYQSGAAV